MRLLLLALLVSGLTWTCSCGSSAEQQASASIQQSDSPTPEVEEKPRVVTGPHHCDVHFCGLPTPSYCTVTCESDQVAVCSCDCTSRVLRVCTEAKGSCTCEDPREVRWWPF
jgi:hypothetical protein